MSYFATSIARTWMKASCILDGHVYLLCHGQAYMLTLAAPVSSMQLQKNVRSWLAYLTHGMMTSACFLLGATY